MFLTFLMVIGAIRPIHSTKWCLNNWFEVLSTRATLIQTLVSQLIGTNKQSIKKLIKSYFFNHNKQAYQSKI